MQQLSPVLAVDAIEPCLEFWADRLGFSILAQMPHGSGIGFAILAREGVQVMYQTRDSLRDDMAALADDDLRGRALLYVKVGDVDEVERALAGCEIVIPRRQTFYGATEIGVREPGGHLVVFGQHETD